MTQHLTAISSMATRRVLADIAAAAVDAGIPQLEIESVGGVDAERRVAAGEAFDLVLLASGALRRLAADGSVDAATVTPLVVSQVAAAAPSSAAAPATAAGGPAWSNAAEMRAALLGAERIGYSTGPSGTALLAMIDDWGLTDILEPRLVQAHPGVPVARLVAEREVDLGLQQLSELVGEPGIRILGTLPDDCAITTVFAGAVAASAADPALALRVLDFFASDEVAAIKTAHSFDAP